MFISEGENQREFKLVPDGSHLAICYGIVDLGTQGYVYMNEKKSAKQLRLLWELHGEDQDGNALSLGVGRRVKRPLFGSYPSHARWMVLSV